MAEIAMREDQLSVLVQSMQEKIAVAEKMPAGAERDAVVAEIKAQMGDAQNAGDLYRLEFRSLTHQERSVYKEKLRAHRANIKKVQAELQWLSSQDNRGELLAGATPARKENMENPDLDNPDALMNHGRQLQDESIKSLQRTVGTVAATKEVAADTAVKVHAQTEQLQSLYDDLYEIDDLLDRSVAIVKRMARRVASQRVLWILTFLIVCGIIVIIVLRTQGKDGSSSTGDRANAASYDPDRDGDFAAPLSDAVRAATSYYRRRRAAEQAGL